MVVDDYLILQIFLLNTSLGLAVAAATKKRTYTMFCILLLLVLFVLMCQVCRGAEGMSVTRTVTRACFIRGPLITASAGLGFD